MLIRGGQFRQLILVFTSAHFCCFSSRGRLGTLVGTEIPRGRGLWKMNWLAIVFSRYSRVDSVLI